MKIVPHARDAEGRMIVVGRGIGAVADVLRTSPLVDQSVVDAETARRFLDSGGAAALAGVALALFNGATWDRQRNNEEATILASAARVASVESAIQTNFNARGAIFFLDVTVNPGGTQTLQLTINMEDPISGTVIGIAVFNADDISGGGTEGRVYIVYPGAVETIDSNQQQVQGLPLPRNYRADVNHSGAGSWTYSLSAAYIL